MNTKQDWLTESLHKTRKVLDELPANQKRALRNDAIFQEARKNQEK